LAKLLRKKTKGVASAFSEVATFPGIYLGKLNLDQASLASVVDSTQKELEHLQSGLRNEIEQKVSNKLSTVPPMGLNSAVAEDIVSKIHDAILLEYSAKFSSFQKMLSGLKNEIGSLEETIEVIELKIDDIDQKNEI
jgi:peptidoglycan hydrolase CwlO-like protein